MKKLKFIAIAMILVFFSTPLFAQVGMEIESVVAEFQTAYNKADYQLISKMFTTNAVRINPDGTTIIGAKRIGDTYASSFTTATLQNDLTVTNTVFESDNKAIVRGTYSITGNIIMDGSPIESKGTFEDIYLKEFGVWKISRMKLF